MKKSILVLIIFVTAQACTPKQERKIAVDILLTLPEGIYNQAIQLNHLIREENLDNFTLNKNHIPHITLLQGFILKSDLPKVKKSLKGVFEIVKNDTLWAKSLQYEKTQGGSFASIEIQKDNSLQVLHQKVIDLIKPYLSKKGSQEAYVQNREREPIDQFTMNYVPTFVSEHSYKNYKPHISLGVAKTSLLDSLSFHIFRSVKFQAASLSIYQLGAFGTAQKLIWKSE